MVRSGSKKKSCDLYYKMKVCDWLLLSMIASYGVAISAVYSYTRCLSSFQSPPSISHVLCSSEKLWVQVMTGMLGMFVFTLLYESYRGQAASFYLILTLLLGILGVLTYPVEGEATAHYLCAGVCFVSILIWSWIASPRRTLTVSQTVAAGAVLLCLMDPSFSSYFFMAQVSFLLVFASTYAVAHFYVRQK